MRNRLIALALSVSMCGAEVASACGGLFQPEGGTVGLDAQRVLFALDGGDTEMVVQISVPASKNAYGVVLPVGAEPKLDPNPVEASAFDELEKNTRPQIVVQPSDAPVGCCGAAARGGGDFGGQNGVLVGDMVKIGPVTAVSLSADTGAALTMWLGMHGFKVPASAQPVIDTYVGPGRWLVAFKRNDAAEPGRSAVGVHLTMKGDHRGYAMRMATIGAADEVAMTAWVIAPEGVGPDAPFAALTLSDLDKDLLRGGLYREAVAQAVAGKGSRAWVVEGVDPAALVLPPSLVVFAPAGAKITRLSTVVARDRMVQDATFTAAAPAGTTDTILVQRDLRGASGPALGNALVIGLALALAAARGRRARA